MHGRGQAFCHPVKTDGRLKPTPVTDALGIIQNVALIRDRRRVGSGGTESSRVEKKVTARGLTD